MKVLGHTQFWKFKTAYLDGSSDKRQKEINREHYRIQCNYDIFQNSGNPARVPRSSVYQALCVPASCSHQDIETAVSQYLQKYQHSAGVQYTVAVAPNLCQTSQQEAFSFEDYIFMLVPLIVLSS
jgi:hypothetical protein